MNATLYEKMDIFPLRAIGIRVAESIGRVCVFPLVICYFLYEITSTPGYIKKIMIALVVVVDSVVFYREVFATKRVIKAALILLDLKITSPTLKWNKLTHIEIAVYNRYKWHVYSFDSIRIKEYRKEFGISNNNVSNMNTNTNAVADEGGIELNDIK